MVAIGVANRNHRQAGSQFRAVVPKIIATNVRG
jgi:hypothetical protein